MSDAILAIASIGLGVDTYLARTDGDPDTVPMVRIRTAYRNLSCKESGPECYRRVVYPGSTLTEWPDADRLPRCDGLAGTRRATVRGEVPLGTIVQDFERDVYKGRRGRCTRRYAIVCQDTDGKPELVWLSHRVLRKRTVDAVDCGPLGIIEIDRPER